MISKVILIAVFFLYAVNLVLFAHFIKWIYRAVSGKTDQDDIPDHRKQALQLFNDAYSADPGRASIILAAGAVMVLLVPYVPIHLAIDWIKHFRVRTTLARIRRSLKRIDKQINKKEA